MARGTTSSGIVRSSSTSMSGSTTRPPLNAASGVRSESGSTSISMPRGGLPLVTAKWTPASCERAHRVDRALRQRLVRPHERPVDIGEHEADHFSER